MDFRYFNLAKKDKPAYPEWFLLIDTDERLQRFVQEAVLFLYCRIIAIRKNLSFINKNLDVFDYPIDLDIYCEIVELQKKHKPIGTIRRWVQKIIGDIVNTYQQKNVIFINNRFKIIGANRDSKTSIIYIPYEYEMHSMKRKQSLEFDYIDWNI